MYVVVNLKHDNETIIPERATELSAGYDVYNNDGDQWIHPLDWRLIKTGLYIDSVDMKGAITSGSFALRPYIQVVPKSGLALRHGLTVLNSPGTIDLDYRDEIGVILYSNADQPVFIKHQQKIAQIIPINCVLNGVKEPVKTRSGGFGSTGV